MQFPTVLIISNQYDFSSDFIAQELKTRNINYLRINRDELPNYSIEFDPLVPILKGSYQNNDFTIAIETLKSIYYRAPTFLRDIFQDSQSEEEQLIRTQWAAFVRSLCVFETVKWLNNPTDIYKAEIKPYQLFLANKLGFKVPATLISNETKNLGGAYIAIKSIDTAIINKGNEEAFIYTELYKQEELQLTKFTSPFFNQMGLVPKMDIRVTVIEEEIVAIKIASTEIEYLDWRKIKNTLDYSVIELPEKIKDLCIRYVKELNLNFGAIDLVIYENDYYFIEINPTGEWSWLQQNTGFKIDALIVNSLMN